MADHSDPLAFLLADACDSTAQPEPLAGAVHGIEPAPGPAHAPVQAEQPQPTGGGFNYEALSEQIAQQSAWETERDAELEACHRDLLVALIGLRGCIELSSEDFTDVRVSRARETYFAARKRIGAASKRFLVDFGWELYHNTLTHWAPIHKAFLRILDREAFFSTYEVELTELRKDYEAGLESLKEAAAHASGPCARLPRSVVRAAIAGAEADLADLRQREAQAWLPNPFFSQRGLR